MGTGPTITSRFNLRPQFFEPFRLAASGWQEQLPFGSYLASGNRPWRADCRKSFNVQPSASRKYRLRPARPESPTLRAIVSPESSRRLSCVIRASRQREKTVFGGSPNRLSKNCSRQRRVIPKDWATRCARYPFCLAFAGQFFIFSKTLGLAIN